MNVQQKKDKIQRLLGSVYARLQQWRQAREKALVQLASMSNLAEQLDALRQCDGTERLGKLSGYPQLAPLLTAKILTSFERALGYVQKENEVMTAACTHLRKLWKEAEKLCTEIIELHGLEESCARTAESFSPVDGTNWMRQLNAAYWYDLNEKQAALSSLSCTPSCMAQVCQVWEREPEGIAEVLDCLNYSVESQKIT